MCANVQSHIFKTVWLIYADVTDFVHELPKAQKKKNKKKNTNMADMHFLDMAADSLYPFFLGHTV